MRLDLQTVMSTAGNSSDFSSCDFQSVAYMHDSGSARESGKVHIQNLGFPLPGFLVSRESPSTQAPTLQPPWLSWAPSLGSSSQKGGGIFNWSFSHRADRPQSKIAKGETRLVLFTCWNAQVVSFMFFLLSPFLISSILLLLAGESGCWKHNPPTPKVEPSACYPESAVL